MSKNTKSPLEMAAVAGTIGFEILAFILIGVWLGRVADQYFGTAPLCLGIGIIVGMAAGITSAFFTVKSFTKD